MKRLLGIFLSALAVHLPTAHAENLVVSAAASLKEAITEVNAAYCRQNPEVKIDLNLGSSGALQQQIEQGAPVDVFISAATKQMDALAAKNLLVAGSRINLLSNEVVLIAPVGAPFPTSFADLTSDKIKHIAIGEPKSVPAGLYAEQIFGFLKISEAVQAKLVFGKDVRAVLTYVETGNVDAGVVYLTDARQSDKVAVISSAPIGSHDSVLYPAAVIASSRHAALAAGYLSFLQSAEARSLFEQRGFKCH